MTDRLTPHLVFLLSSLLYSTLFAVTAHAQETGTPTGEPSSQEAFQSQVLAASSGPNVGVLAYCADLTGGFGAANTVNTLEVDGRFGSVTLIDGDEALPTASQLLDQFDCVIAMTDNRCGVPMPQGIVDSSANALAGFVNDGGGVVVSTFGFSTTLGFGDAIFGATLSPFQPVQGSNGSAGTIDVADAASSPQACLDMMTGVTAPVSSNWSNVVNLSAGAALCTSYASGEGLLAINPNGNIVGLNTFPADQYDNTQTSYRTLVGNAVFQVCNTNEPPDCSSAATDPGTLWPADHLLTAISVVGVTDPDGDPVTITPTAVTQDEAVTGEGIGSGNTSPDAELSPLALRAERNGSPRFPETGRVYHNALRAERSGSPTAPGNGRMYHIDFTADDGKGGACNGTVNVCVPHQQRPGSSCVDDGPIFNSLVAASADGTKADVCHVPLGDPQNAHVISVSVDAVPAHLANHGDEVVPEDDTCTAGVGECAVGGSLACTSRGLVCDAQPAEPPEETELTCDDGRDNDCDGLTDDADEDCPDLFFPEGPQVNVPVDDLVGWELCDVRPYDSSTGLALTSILAACDKANLLLACRPTGSSILTVLAAAPRADVLFDTGAGNTPHDANGTGWYFNGDYSWGFAEEGAPISRSSCDTEGWNDPLRLCWHTHQFDVGGWRCGTATDLNFSNGWEKLIYHAD